MTPKPVCYRRGSYYWTSCSKTITGSLFPTITMKPSHWLHNPSHPFWPEFPPLPKCSCWSWDSFLLITSSLPLLVFFCSPNNFLLLFSAFLKSYVFSNPQCKFHFPHNSHPSPNSQSTVHFC